MTCIQLQSKILHLHLNLDLDGYGEWGCFNAHAEFAADNNNSVAQYNVGDLYIGVTTNVPLGMKYLKLAASASCPRAIELLQHYEIITFLSETNIYEASQYNKNICNASMDRVDKLKLLLKLLDLMKDISQVQDISHIFGSLMNDFEIVGRPEFNHDN
ncbi:12161_t:CDS:2 [Funneliformis caledonium]|uniref:12161_t:CDS:1 n=1 Tax=Funneliformis caledonium TaxID=1117310 RepID=A0A9N9H7A0_9GLOM|nr:12161_t:CDS:2 [Funneliformis caledonium]